MRLQERVSIVGRLAEVSKDVKEAISEAKFYPTAIRIKGSIFAPWLATVAEQVEKCANEFIGLGDLARAGQAVAFAPSLGGKVLGTNNPVLSGLRGIARR